MRSPRPVASPASSSTGGGPRRSATSTASTASRAWATRSPARGAPRWPGRDDEVITFVGDGSYMMMNSDLYSSVLSGPQADRDRLRQRRLRGHQPAADQPGRRAVQQPDREHAPSRAGVRRLRRARRGDGLQQRTRRRRCTSSSRRSNGRATATAPRSSPCRPMRTRWTGGGAFWEVGVPEVSDRPEVQAAKAAMVSRTTTTEDRNMTGKLDGKVIVVSGGTQGLGEAIARQVVADGAAGSGDRRTQRRPGRGAGEGAHRPRHARRCSSKPTWRTPPRREP